MSRLEMKTWRNSLKLSKWHEEIPTDDKVIPWIASSKSSDQKDCSKSHNLDTVLTIYSNKPIKTWNYV